MYTSTKKILNCLLRNKEQSYLLQSPTIFLPFFDNFCCFFGNGFLEAMLQPHIEAAGGTVTQGGIAFFMQGFIFMIGMVICGYVSLSKSFRTMYL